MDSRENKQLDELFKSKLEGHESPAGEELWGRLNKERLSKVKPAWYERKALAAAVVAAVAVAGGIWLGMPAGRETLSASESGNVSGIPLEVAQESAPPAGPDSAATVYAVASGTANRVSSDAAKKEAVKVAGIPAGERIPERKDLKGLRNEPAAPAEESSRETAQVAAGPVPVAEKEAEEQRAGTRVLVVYVRPPASADAAPEKPGYELAAAAESHENEAAEERKKLSFKRFFRQLKNAKTGEKIDWEELGLNPQRVFANVDHSGGQAREAGGQ